jgi:hypothetical protein
MREGIDKPCRNVTLSLLLTKFDCVKKRSVSESEGRSGGLVHGGIVNSDRSTTLRVFAGSNISAISGGMDIFDG